MKIAYSTIYGEQYTEDKLFKNESCALGENLLMPNILLKKILEEKGHEIHTVDMYPNNDYDAIIFQEIPIDSLLTIHNPMDFIKYWLKKKWKKDFLKKAVFALPSDKIILLVSEPPIIAPLSYNKNYHHYFGKILTWNDDIVDDNKYFKLCIPQYRNKTTYCVNFEQKRDYVMIAGNKRSSYDNELYSERRKIIGYFEEITEDLSLDLYGFGWEQEKLDSYKGTIEKKLECLSKYKFCFCLENVKEINGYITEKIFDCFFAGCIPIYWGAENVEDFIPADIFIDMRNFKSLKEIIDFTEHMTEEQYAEYLNRTKFFLNSSQFRENFSVDHYISVMLDLLINK